MEKYKTIKHVYTTYAPDTGITFILEDILNLKENEVISTEVKGFYFGEPMETRTRLFYGKTKAEF